jgi:sulfite exporter TauE/SafE
MGALILTVFGASLAGSLHCAGMCGTLVAFAVGTPDSPGRRRIDLHVLYHGGRLVTYTLIGVLCGLAGAALNLGGAQIGLQRTAAILAGVLMVIVGIVALLRYSNVHIPHLRVPKTIESLLLSAQRGAAALRPAPRAATIGLLTGFLPCGWLYMFALTAAGTGSWLWGAAVMAAFWAGTVPILISVGFSAQLLTGWLGKRAPLVTTVVLIGLGLYTIVGRINVAGRAFADTPAVQTDSPAAAAERVKSLDAHEAPCCHHNGG